MNRNLIEKLYNEAADYCVSHAGDNPAWQWEEKFAELIVKECLKQIPAADVGDLRAKAYYLDRVQQHVEDHFGIELIS